MSKHKSAHMPTTAPRDYQLERFESILDRVAERDGADGLSLIIAIMEVIGEGHVPRKMLPSAILSHIAHDSALVELAMQKLLPFMEGYEGKVAA